MYKLKFIFAALVVFLFLACTSTKVGLKENWIDERDMMALINTPINEWIQNSGRPTLVEISGDTSIYYYNYRPTLYMAAVYDSTTFFKTWGKAEESKPSLANATEVWGSRRNVVQIKIVQETVISAAVVDGPDKSTFIRDLNGKLVLDPKSGYVANYSEEIKVKGDFNEFIKEYSRLNVKTEPVPVDTAALIIPAEQHLIGTPADTVSNHVPENPEHHATPASPTAVTDSTHAVSAHAPAAVPHVAVPDTVPVAPAHHAPAPATSAPAAPETVAPVTPAQ